MKLFLNDLIVTDTVNHRGIVARSHGGGLAQKAGKLGFT